MKQIRLRKDEATALGRARLLGGEAPAEPDSGNDSVSEGGSPEEKRAAMSALTSQDAIVRRLCRTVKDGQIVQVEVVASRKHHWQKVTFCEHCVPISWANAAVSGRSAAR